MFQLLAFVQTLSYVRMRTRIPMLLIPHLLIVHLLRRRLGVRPRHLHNFVYSTAQRRKQRADAKVGTLHNVNRTVASTRRLPQIYRRSSGAETDYCPLLPIRTAVQQFHVQRVLVFCHHLQYEYDG